MNAILRLLEQMCYLGIIFDYSYEKEMEMVAVKPKRNKQFIAYHVSGITADEFWEVLKIELGIK